MSSLCERLPVGSTSLVKATSSVAGFAGLADPVLWERPPSGAGCQRSGGRSPKKILEFKDVVASPCKLVQVGKRTTRGVASTALDGGSRVEVVSACAASRLFPSHQGGSALPCGAFKIT
jgi:hypothetical protein